jgi:hypothetical protein
MDVKTNGGNSPNPGKITLVMVSAPGTLYRGDP